MGKGPNEVNFTAYCTAFKAIDPEAADGLCQALDTSEDFWTPAMFRDKPGDGYVLVPSYKEVLGKRQITSWQSLNQDGEIHTGLGEDAKRTDGVDDNVAQYFIAGAFGADELSGNVALDAQLLKGLKELYAECSRDDKKCLETDAAARVSQRWQTVMSELKEKEKQEAELAQTAAKIKKLDKQLTLLIDKTENKSDVEGKIATYRLAMPKNPTTLEDYKKVEELYTQMIRIAEMNLKEYSKAKESADMQSGIPYYEAEATRLAKEIDDEEPFGYSRFTDAIEAGLKCMPKGQTLQERYCVAKNKYEMVNGLYGMVKNFPQHEECIKSELREVSEGSGGGIIRGGNPRVQHKERVCLEEKMVGKDYSSDYLLDFAKGYCSTTCQ